MKADRREVILWKVRIISTGNAISSEVLKIKETFTEEKAAGCSEEREQMAEPVCCLQAGPEHRDAGGHGLWKGHSVFVNEMLCAVPLVCFG